MSAFTKYLDNLECKNYSSKLTNDGFLKLQLETIPEFTRVQASLKAAGKEFFYFQLTSEKPFKIVIKGIHVSVTEQEIRDDLEAKGFQVTRVHRAARKVKDPTQGADNQLLKRLQPTQLVFVDLVKTEGVKEVLNLTGILHQVIKVEAPKKSIWQPQCKRCQRYGHVQARCSLPYRCVKCLNNHKSSECDKTESGAKCVNCQLDHPANYKSCSFAKKAGIRTATTKETTPTPHDHQYAFPNLDF